MSVFVFRPLVSSPEIARQKFPLREVKLAPRNRLFLNRGTVNQDSWLIPKLEGRFLLSRN